MSRLLLIATAVFFTSCKSISRLQNADGQYYAKGRDYSYSLWLEVNSSFVFTQKYFEVNSTCQGKWKYLSKDTILLQCNEDLSAKLQSGYMSTRVRKIIVLNKNRLQIDKIVLKRKI